MTRWWTASEWAACSSLAVVCFLALVGNREDVVSVVARRIVGNRHQLSALPR
jgi:hypothetical protein